MKLGSVDLHPNSALLEAHRSVGSYVGKKHWLTRKLLFVVNERLIYDRYVVPDLTTREQLMVIKALRRTIQLTKADQPWRTQEAQRMLTSRIPLTLLNTHYIAKINGSQPEGLPETKPSSVVDDNLANNNGQFALYSGNGDLHKTLEMEPVKAEK